MTTILVTGGAGFVGSCFVRRMLGQDDCRVVVLDKLTYAGSLQNLASVRDDPRLVFQQGDIADKVLVRQLLDMHRPNWVVNCAAESHVDRSIDAPGIFVQTNVLGTCRLCEACLEFWLTLPAAQRDAFRLLQVSTDEVYGPLDATGRFTAESRYAPRSPYAASKASADHLVGSFFYTYGLPIIVTNASNNYGPFQFPEKLIPLMIYRATAGKTLPIYGDGQHVRDWLHVADHARGLEAAVRRGRPGESYLFGGNCERSNVELVESICRVLDRIQPRDDATSYLAQITFVPDRPGHDRRYAIDNEPAHRRLGWAPQLTLEDGLPPTVTWYLEHRSWVEHRMRDAYDGRRLGMPRD